MGYLNKVQIIGNLGADPESKYLTSGDMVVNLSLATTEKWKDKQTGEPKEKTEWHRISFFGRAAEVIAEYCRKGDSIYIEGSLQTRKYEKDGQTHYATDIKGRNFQFLGGRRDDSDGTGPAPRQPAPESESPAPAARQDDLDDDIPF
jgi:single-strand DNA-binding protein